MGAQVSLVECQDYDDDRVYSAVKESLLPLGGMEAFVAAGQKVLLQANVLAPRAADTAICTHPSVISAVCRLVGEAGGIPWVGGSSAATGACRTAATLRVSGIGEAARRAGAEVFDYDETGGVDTPSGGPLMPAFHIGAPVLDADVIITVPKLKTHASMLLTGAVKNHLGVIPGARKAELHRRYHDRERFGAALAELYATTPPHLAIMDAVQGMDKDGPAAGRRRQVGLVAASGDPVALDAAMCAVCGIDTRWVPTLAACAAYAIGRPSLEDIEVVGLPLARAREKVPPFVYPTTYRLATSRWFPDWGARLMERWSGAPSPFVRGDACTACKTCVRACPVEALGVVGKAASIDQNKCISCFCCHEVCPEEAIGIKGPLMWRMLGAWDRGQDEPPPATPS